MNIEAIQDFATQTAAHALAWVSSAAFYSQVALIVIAGLAAFLLARLLKRHLAVFKEAPTEH